MWGPSALASLLSFGSQAPSLRHQKPKSIHLIHIIPSCLHPPTRFTVALFPLALKPSWPHSRKLAPPMSSTSSTPSKEILTLLNMSPNSTLLDKSLRWKMAISSFLKAEPSLAILLPSTAPSPFILPNLASAPSLSNGYLSTNRIMAPSSLPSWNILLDLCAASPLLPIASRSSRTKWRPI